MTQVTGQSLGLWVTGQSAGAVGEASEEGPFEGSSSLSRQGDRERPCGEDEQMTVLRWLWLLGRA